MKNGSRFRGRKILIVTDGKAGHENQSRAFCTAMGCGFDLVKVSYGSKLAKGCAYLCDRFGIKTASLFRADRRPMPTGYAAVVCTGSTAFYPGKVFARQMGVPVCAILTPRGFKMDDFDCILAPQFDNPPKLPNVVTIPVNLTATSQQFYKDGVRAFEERHHARKAAVGVVIGGPNGFAKMSREEMKRKLDNIFSMTGAYERWVTTSRRTPPEIEELVDSYPFDYKLIYSADKFNPIPAFVMLCDRIFVTADSTGMLSEAVTQGKAKVEVINNLKDSSSKFARFVEGLVSVKAAHVFDGSLGFAANKIDLQPAFEDAKKILMNAKPRTPEKKKARPSGEKNSAERSRRHYGRRGGGPRRGGNWGARCKQ